MQYLACDSIFNHVQEKTYATQIISSFLRDTKDLISSFLRDTKNLTPTTTNILQLQSDRF